MVPLVLRLSGREHLSWQQESARGYLLAFGAGFWWQRLIDRSSVLSLTGFGSLTLLVSPVFRLASVRVSHQCLRFAQLALRHGLGGFAVGFVTLAVGQIAVVGGR